MDQRQASGIHGREGLQRTPVLADGVRQWLGVTKTSAGNHEGVLFRNVPGTRILLHHLFGTGRETSPAEMAVLVTKWNSSAIVQADWYVPMELFWMTG